MFHGKDGSLSTTKLLAVLSFFCFVIVTAYVLYKIPEKFNYEIFAVFTMGAATGLRGFDKYLNTKENKQ